MKISTTIGSMPHKDGHQAVELIVENTPLLPAWPQLPRRNFRENMTAQYSENFPGIEYDDTNMKIWVSDEKALMEMEKFYTSYLARDIDYFEITPNASGGIYALKEFISRDKNITAVKCQTAGPITYSMMLKNQDDRSIFFDENLKETALKNIIMKSLWQLKFFEGKCKVLFLDEPYLSAYGSAFTAINREDVVFALKSVIDEIKTSAMNIFKGEISDGKSLQIGVHCCGNTDWSMLIEAGVDIISFDSYSFMESLLLTSEDMMKNFLGRGGIFAFGAVPTSTGHIHKETISSLKNRLLKDIQALADKKNISKEKIINQMYITPSCGLGSMDEEAAVKALQLTGLIAREF